MRFRTFNVRRNPACPACGTRELKELIDYEAFCGIPSTDAAASGHAGKDPARGGGEIPEIEPVELAARLAANDSAIDLIDVREPHEWQIARIPGARLIPLGALEASLDSLRTGRDTIVYCRSGARSAKAVRRLIAAGHDRVWNLAGGVLRWSDDVDPTVAKY
jgi:adenylyltransferase/sulfurtransferase